MEKCQINKAEIDLEVAKATRKRLLTRAEVSECKLDAIRHILQSGLSDEHKMNAIRGIMM